MNYFSKRAIPMFTKELSVEFKPADFLSQDETNAIIDLCSRAYEEDYTPYLDSFKNPVHVLGKLNGKLVSHVLWIVRWLQTEDSFLLKTAYVEAVATESVHRGKGYATTIMKCLGDEIQTYDLGGLSPADTTLYSRLGWEYWQGPLYARIGKQWILVPGETVMVFRTGKTPPLDIRSALSVEWREGEIW